MLSRIIERSSGSEVDCLVLDLVNVDPTPPASTRSHPSEPDVSALTDRIARLEHSLVETEAAAYARGRREAESEAQQRFASSMQSTAERLAQSIKQLADIRPRIAKEAEVDLLQLSLAIAQRILHREINIDPTALEALVKVSLDRLGRQDQLRVRLTPALVEPVRAILAKLGSRPTDVAPDPALEAGGIVFETTRGQLDVSIHSQLNEIERGLIDHLEKR